MPERLNHFLAITSGHCSISLSNTLGKLGAVQNSPFAHALRCQLSARTVTEVALVSMTFVRHKKMSMA